MLKAILVTIFLLLGQAFAIDLELSSSADKAVMTTGDMLKFSITIKSDPTVSITIPELGDKIEGFRVVDFGTVDPKVVDGVKSVVRYYNLQADLVGSYILPAVSLSHNGKEYKTSEIFVEVKSVLRDVGKEENKLKDIKGIIPNPSKIGLMIVIGFILLVLIISGLGFMWWRQLKRRKSTDTVESPDVIATKELLALEAERLFESGNVKRYHFRLSEIVRVYIEGRFGFRATDMTTEEIKKNISRAKLDIGSDIITSFFEILDKTDIVKFTDIILPKTESESLIIKARAIINNTRQILADNESDGSVV